MPYRQLGLVCEPSCLPNLIVFLKKLGFEVKALWCSDQDGAIQVAAEHEIPFVASRPDEVLLRKEVEMILITAKPCLHSQICEKALGIGKHVLCASPAALNSIEAAKMVLASQYYPQILSLVGFSLRHLDVFRQMKKFIAQGYLGSPLMCEVRVHSAPLTGEKFDWRWEPDMGGGILNLVGSHLIDLIAVLLDEKAERVQGLVRSHGRPRHLTNGFRKLNSDDFCSFLLKYRSNAVSATVTLNSLCDGNAHFEQEVLVCGTEGRLVARNFKLFGAQTKNGGEESLLFDEDSSPDSAVRYSISNHKMKESGLVPELYARGFAKMLQSLSGAIPQYNSKMESTGGSWKEKLPVLGTVAGFEDAQYVRAVIEAVRRSSSRGDWVRVNCDID